jgi:DNA-binding NarL/FixJ family response regulator
MMRIYKRLWGVYRMRVVIIDDNPTMHMIMVRMLEQIPEAQVIGSFRDARSAYAFLKKELVDLVLLDIHMPGEDGLGFAKRLREEDIMVRIVFVTSHRDYALAAFDVYAYDYITKPVSQERLRRTVVRAMTEEKEHSERSVAVAPPQDSLVEPLTKREAEVLQLVSKGLSNKEIASALAVSEGTVKNHMVNIFSKMQVKNRIQATAVAKGFRWI